MIHSPDDKFLFFFDNEIFWHASNTIIHFMNWKILRNLAEPTFIQLPMSFTQSGAVAMVTRSADFGAILIKFMQFYEELLA